MPESKKLDELAAISEREFLRERRKDRAVQCAGYTAACICGLIFLMMIGGPTFDPVLNLLGLNSLWTEEGGVYADCSLKENRENRFCSGKDFQTKQQWKHIAASSGGKPVPFNLAER